MFYGVLAGRSREVAAHGLGDLLNLFVWRINKRNADFMRGRCVVHCHAISTSF